MPYIGLLLKGMNYLSQGLSQDFKTARPNPAMIPKQPVQPILGISIHIAREPGSDPVLREKKEITVQWKRPFRR